MIKGNTKPVLNEFANAIEEMIGDHLDGGYVNYFDSLYDTFSRAEKYLKEEAKTFKEELKKEDPDTAFSMLRSSESIAYPHLERLYESYFITLHSELEIIWCDKIQGLYSVHFPGTPIDFQKLSYNYQYLIQPRCFIDTVVANHQILLAYNFIRNGLVHYKGEGPNLNKVQQKIKDGEIKDVETKNENGKVKFAIKNLQFGKVYSQEILALLNELVKINPVV